MTAFPLRRLQRPRWAVACFVAALCPAIEREAWLWELMELRAKAGEA